MNEEHHQVAFAGLASSPFAVVAMGIATVLLSAGIWIPLGFVVSIAVLIFAVKSKKAGSRIILVFKIAALVMVLLTCGYVGGLVSVQKLALLSAPIPHNK